jgi:hypothetical protein
MTGLFYVPIIPGSLGPYVALNVDKCELFSINSRAEFILKIKQCRLINSNLKFSLQAAFLNIVHLATLLARMKNALMFSSIHYNM